MRIPKLGTSFLTLLFIGLILGSLTSVFPSELDVRKAWAPPGPVLVDFENLADREIIFNQYANLGVIFQGSSVKDFVQSPGFAHSGVKTIQSCPIATEFCSSPIRVSFTTPQKHIKLWIGSDFPFNEPKQVVLRAFDSNGVQVGESSQSIPASTSPVKVSIPLEVNTNGPRISSAFVNIADPETCLCSGSLTIDDLEFNAVGTEPPCQTTQNPSLLLNHPVSGGSSQFDSFLLDGNVFSEVVIEKANITATLPTGETRTANLLPSIISPNGGSFATNLGGLLLPGNNVVSLKVQNCHGSMQVDRTVAFTPIMPGTRLNFMGIEATQAIQSMDNSIPLITDKRTFARVYFSVNGPTNQLTDVTGVLAAYTAPGLHKGGEFIGTVTSLNSIKVNNSNDIFPKRANIDGSLNFEIPLNWIDSPGQIHFSVTPYIEGRVQGSTASLVPCEDVRVTAAWRLSGCDNLDEHSASSQINNLDFFDSVPSARIEIIGIPYTITPPNTIVPTQTDFDHLTSWLERAYPTAQVLGGVTTNAGTGYNGVPDSAFDCHDVDADLHDRWVLDTTNGGVNRDTRYYGVVSDTGGFMRGCALEIPSPVASGPAGTGDWGWDFDGAYNDWYGGHETAHMYGRHHPGFADIPGSCTRDDSRQPNDDDDYPYLDGLIGIFGFDVGEPSISVSPDVKSPSKWTDVMTYRCFQWISDYTYRGIMNELRSQDFVGNLLVTSSSQLSNLPEVAKETNMTLSVVGNLNVNKSSVDLKPFKLLPGLTLTARPANSSFTIELLGNNSKVIEQYPFEPKNYTDRLPGEDQIALIGEMVPYLPGVKQIAISKNGETLALRNVSSSSPEVKMVVPNGGEAMEPEGNITISWNGTDGNRDKLRYSLLYSANGGENWKTINSAINETSYKVDLEDLPGSDQALFRVIATDSINTDIADSNATFSIPSKPPNVRIISPADSSTFDSGKNITFTGEALDLEDGMLEGNALTWASDKQGTLGFGPSISFDELSPGLHEITLSARDTNGNMSNDSIRLQIYPIPSIAVAEIEQDHIAQNIVPLNGTMSAGSGQITYQWNIVSKPNQSNATIINPNSAEPRLVTDLNGTYSIQLMTRDDTGLTAIDQIVAKK
jgi:hypothetical protein